MEFVELTEKEYASFADGHPYACFQQTPFMMNTKKKEGAGIVYLGVKENNQVLAACGFTITPIMKKMNYFYASRGILIDYHNTELLNYYIAELKKYGKKHKALFMRIDPNVLLQERDIDGNIVENGFDNHDIVENLKASGLRYCGETVGFRNDQQVRFMFVLDLKNKTKEDILKNMDQQTRWSVNKTIKMGIKIEEVDENHLDEFKAIMDETAIRRGFMDRSVSFYQHMKQSFGDDFKIMLSYLDTDDYERKMEAEKCVHLEEKKNVEELLEKQPNSKKFLKRHKVVLEAIDIADKRIKEAQELREKHGKRLNLACSTFICVGKEVVYFMSGAREEYMRFNGPYALQWHMIQKALEMNKERYNFYGTSGDFRKEAIDYGVYEFKKGFDGTVEEYIGDFILPVSPLFSLYNRLRKVVDES